MEIMELTVPYNDNDFSPCVVPHVHSRVKMTVCPLVVQLHDA